MKNINPSRMITVITLVVLVLILLKIYKSTQEIQQYTMPVVESTPEPALPEAAPTPEPAAAEPVPEPAPAPVEKDDGTLNAAQLARRLRDFNLSVGYLNDKKLKASEIVDPSYNAFFGRIDDGSTPGVLFTVVIGRSGTPEALFNSLKAKFPDIKDLKTFTEVMDGGDKFRDQKTYTYTYFGYGHMGVGGINPINGKPIFLALGRPGSPGGQDEVYATISFPR